MPSRPLPPQPPTILAIDSDPRAQRRIRRDLDPRDYQVLATTHGQQALDLIRTHSPALVLLEAQLADRDGVALCRQIRAESAIPIIFLSASVPSSAIVRAFAAGADDYLTKPYDPLELAARIGAVLRRSAAPAPPQPPAFQAGPLTIDFPLRRVTLNGSEVPLSRTEYRLLEHLAHHAGRTLVADALVVQVWGPEYAGDVASLHLYISRLRRKLQENGATARLIVTKPGIGYELRAVEPSPGLRQDLRRHERPSGPEGSTCPSPRSSATTGASEL